MAEKEYIERGALLEEMQDRKYANPENYFQRGVNASVDILTTDIKHIPAADVVEVVRCENCQHCKMVVDIIGDPHLFCGLSSNNAAVQFGDFCSYGERKEATP